jgi:hypothetical protein
LQKRVASLVVPWQIVLYLGIAALMGSMYDIVHNHFVKITSSMNMAIVGNLKVRAASALVTSPPRATLAALFSAQRRTRPAHSDPTTARAHKSTAGTASRTTSAHRASRCCVSRCSRY